jgi:succinyl-CoA synthetase alpha subunit
LKINKKMARILAIDYGTKIVGGVNNKKAGSTHLGLPVYGTVAEGKKYT